MEPDKEHVRFLFRFYQKKSVADTYIIICETYGENIIAVKTCASLFKRFKNGDSDINDKEHSGCAAVKENEVQGTILLNEDQSTRELALQLHHSTIVRRLNAM